MIVPYSTIKRVPKYVRIDKKKGRPNDNTPFMLLEPSNSPRADKGLKRNKPYKTRRDKGIKRPHYTIKPSDKTTVKTKRSSRKDKGLKRSLYDIKIEKQQKINHILSFKTYLDYINSIIKIEDYPLIKAQYATLPIRIKLNKNDNDEVINEKKKLQKLKHKLYNKYIHTKARYSD